MSEKFMLHVGSDGTFTSSGSYSTTSNQLIEFISNLDSHKLTLHVHGGLNDEASGMQIAEMMSGVYEQADNATISLIWETGLLETFKQNLNSINRTRLFQKLLKLIIKRTASSAISAGVRGSGRTSSDEVIEDELRKQEPFSELDDWLVSETGARGSLVLASEDELIAEFEADIAHDYEIEELLKEKDREGDNDVQQRGLFSSVKIAIRLGKIAIRVIKRMINKRDHGFYPTVVEELLRELYLADIGAWVWQKMKDKAQAMWLPSLEKTDQNAYVGDILLKCLLEKQQQSSQLQINLVGHSAGAIVLCHMLNVAMGRFEGLHFNNVIFLAPAARCDLATSAIVGQSDIFNNFHLYTMSDTYEKADQLVSKVYTRSLLYFISGVLEPDEIDMPISGMMRYVDDLTLFQNENVDAWAEFIKQEDRTTLSNSQFLDPDAIEGRRSFAAKHGDFDNDRMTQESLIFNLS